MKTYSWGVIALAASSWFAVAAHAQVNTLGTNQTYMTGRVQGTVQYIDLNRGDITINTGSSSIVGGTSIGTGTSGSISGGTFGGTVTLHARPFDIANLTPGDVVSVVYSNYNGQLWVAPESTGSVNGSWAQMGTVTGPVGGVDRRQGLIEIRGQIFHAHPQQTTGLFPGQFVSLTFAQVGNTPWVDSLQQAGNVGDIGTGGFFNAPLNQGTLNQGNLGSGSGTSATPPAPKQETEKKTETKTETKP